MHLSNISLYYNQIPVSSLCLEHVQVVTAFLIVRTNLIHSHAFISLEFTHIPPFSLWYLSLMICVSVRAQWLKYCDTIITICFQYVRECWVWQQFERRVSAWTLPELLKTLSVIYHHFFPLSVSVDVIWSELEPFVGIIMCCWADKSVL